MKKIIDGISVETNGQETNQSIVFIHGFPFDHTLWNDVISDLKDDYYCISYDIRGFGNSEVNSGQYTMESYTEDLETIISKLELNKPIICGFSMGGYIALRAIEKVQDNYKALILANTTTSSDNDEAKLKRASGISSINKDGIGPFLDKFFSVAFSDNYSKKEIAKLKSKIVNFSTIGIKGALLAMISRTDTTENLNKINIPVLMITSDEDKVIPPETMKDMAGKVKNCSFISLKSSGHLSMLENPKEFTNALKAFILII